MMIRILLLLALITLPFCARPGHAQENVGKTLDDLDMLEQRIKKLRQEEEALLKQKRALLDRLQNALPKERDRQEADEEWNLKNMPTISMRAKLRSVSTSRPVLPAVVSTRWFVTINGQHIHLIFEEGSQPTDLRGEKDVEVIIKGKLQIRSLRDDLPRNLERTAQQLFGSTLMLLNVESLERAAPAK